MPRARRGMTGSRGWMRVSPRCRLTSVGWRGNGDWLAAPLAAELPGVAMRVPEATYLACLDCGALELSCPAGQFFLDQAKVGLNFGETFGADYGGFVRLNFATPTAILRE